MSAASWCSTCFCVVLCVGFCAGHFVMVPKLTYLHCLQRFFFEHRFNLYFYRTSALCAAVISMDDNTRSHRALVAREYLEREVIERMDWPDRSPDLEKT